MVSGDGVVGFEEKGREGVGGGVEISGMVWSFGGDGWG